MHEGDLETEETAAGLGVDQLGAGGGEVGKGAADIRYLVGDVVHAGPALGQEPADGRVVAECGEQLDPAFTDAHRRGLDSLLLDPLPVLEPAAEEPLVRANGLVEVRDRDADVVDPPCFHPGDAIR